MKKLIAAIVLLAAGGSASGYYLRTLTGTFINPAGGAAITTGYVAVTPIGNMPATIPNGALVPLPPYRFPIVSGVLTCTSTCQIVAPANYSWQVYETVSGSDIPRWSFTAGVPDVNAAITIQEIYAAKYVAPNPPATIVTVTGGATGATGPTGPAGPAGSSSPGGSTGQVQYNNAGALGGVTGSVVSSNNVSLTGSVTATGGFVGALTGNASTATSATSATSAATAATATTASALAAGTYAYDGSGTVTVNANTSKALASSPTVCSGNNFSLGIGANGNASCSQPTYANLGGVVPTWDQDTTGNAATADTATTAQNIAVSNATDAATYYPTFVSAVSGTSGFNANAGLNFVPSTGVLTAATFAGALDGNANTATDGVVTTGSYADPAWLTSIAGSKVSGNIAGQAGSVADGLYSTGSYADPTWIISLSGAKVSGDIAGQAGSVANGVYTTGTYTDPDWITSLAGSKISGNIAGNAGTVTAGVYTTGSYSDPSWITGLAGSKISGDIAGNAGTATALASSPTQCSGDQFALGIATSGNANCAQPSFSNLTGTATWSQISKSGALLTDLGSTGASNGYVPIADGAGGINWGAQSGGGGGGGFTPPAGTGLVHITSSSMDGTAHLLVDADVSGAAAIAWSKISKSGAVASDVGAAATAAGVSSASGTSPLNLSFSSNVLSGTIDNATTGTPGAIELSGDLGGTGLSPTVGSIGGSTAANVHAAELAANAATDANTASTIVKRDASGNFAAGTVTANLVGDASGNAGTVTNGVYITRQVIAGTGLTGGGPLSSNVTLAMSNPVATALGGVGTNLSVTGPGFLKQATTGANVTVTGIASTDLPASGTWTLSGNLGITGSNVGIGTASPTHTLDVVGDVGIQTLPITTAPGNGQTWGITMTGQTAGEDLAQGAVAYLYSDGKWYNAKADAAATSGPVELGVCPVAIGIGTTGIILIEGVVQITGWGLTTGSLYYVDTATAGSITTSAPVVTGQQVRAVGHALSTESLYFHPSSDWGEVQ